MGVPWSCPQAVLRRDKIREEYCDGNGFLPGNLPLVALKTPDWLSPITIPIEAKKCGPHENIRASQRRFFRAVLDRLACTPSALPILWEFDIGTWYYHILGEREYDENLASFATAKLTVAQVIDQRLHGVVGVRQEAIFWCRPILPAEFRTIKRYSQSFFKNTVRLERRMRSATGFLFLITCVRQNRL